MVFSRIPAEWNIIVSCMRLGRVQKYGYIWLQELEKSAKPLYPAPVIVILKLKDVMLLLIDDEIDSVSVALTEAPGAKL
jgi:hypothetical protein